MWLHMTRVQEVALFGARHGTKRALSNSPIPLLWRGVQWQKGDRAYSKRSTALERPTPYFQTHPNCFLQNTRVPASIGMSPHGAWPPKLCCAYVQLPYFEGPISYTQGRAPGKNQSGDLFPHVSGRKVVELGAGCGLPCPQPHWNRMAPKRSNLTSPFPGHPRLVGCKKSACTCASSMVRNTSCPCIPLIIECFHCVMQLGGRGKAQA